MRRILSVSSLVVSHLLTLFSLAISAQQIPQEALLAQPPANEGDAFALEVFRKMGMYLGIAMANVVNIFNPEMIIVGGGVSESFELFASYARDEIIKRAFPVRPNVARF